MKITGKLILKVEIIVKASARESGIEILSNSSWKIKTPFPALDGKANKDVICQIAFYLKIPKKKVKIIMGEKSKKKLVEIDI